jgi:hypothetical protein
MSSTWLPVVGQRHYLACLTLRDSVTKPAAIPAPSSPSELGSGTPLMAVPDTVTETAEVSAVISARLLLSSVMLIGDTLVVPPPSAVKSAIASNVLPVNPGPGPLRLSAMNEMVPLVLSMVPDENETPLAAK